MSKLIALLSLPLLFACTTTRAPHASPKLSSASLVAPSRELVTESRTFEGLLPQQAGTSPFQGTGSNRRFVIPQRPRWSISEAYLQGFIGVSQFKTAEVTGGPIDVDGDDGDLDQVPYIGGGGQWKLGGERFDWGLEGMLGFGGRANTTAFVAGGGGALIAVDVDLLILEFYGGPFINRFIGDKLRVYGAAGPLFQFVDYDQKGATIQDDSGTGFGFGGYARAGFEFLLPNHMWLGIGVRWSDTTVDLGTVGDLDMEGFLGLITLTRRD